MSIKRELRKTNKQVLEQLSRLRDRAKLQLHLLSLDARLRWCELEKDVEALEAQALREGENATEALQRAGHDLIHALNEILAQHVSHSVGLATSVRALMTTHARSCKGSDSLDEAAQLMWNEDCGAIPVLEDERVVAVITDRDVCMATYTQGKPPRELTVAGSMSREIFSCAADDSIASALALMGDKRVRRLPVLASDGKLVGMLALADIARWAKSANDAIVDAALVECLSAISSRSPQKLHAAAE